MKQDEKMLVQQITTYNYEINVKVKLNQSETKTVEMPHLSIQDRDGTTGHQSDASVAQVSKILNFKK